MSFFAYLGLVGPDAAQRRSVLELLHARGYRGTEAHLAQEFGARALYGVDVPVESLFEVELSGAEQDLEALLLEPEQADARWRHYTACAARLGRTVDDFRQDEEVDRLYQESPLELRVVTLLRELAGAVTARPLVLNLDPDFALHLGRGETLTGLDEIRRGVWDRTTFRDLETPLRLVVPG